jgi:hypothetical protein
LTLKLLEELSFGQSGRASPIVATRPIDPDWELSEMTNLRFRDLPLVVRVSSVASMMAAWVLFEQIVIEGLGIYPFLPYYRYGKFCPYDIAAGLSVATFWIVAHRSKGADPVQS